MDVRERRIQELSVPPVEFCCKPNTAVKHEGEEEVFISLDKWCHELGKKKKRRTRYLGTNGLLRKALCLRPTLANFEPCDQRRLCLLFIRAQENALLQCALVSNHKQVW
jgi:hypothetical protein